MTVRELREALAGAPDDLVVHVVDREARSFDLVTHPLIPGQPLRCAYHDGIHFGIRHREDDGGRC